MASVAETVVWVHGDCLNPYSFALRQHEGAPALWVWDEAVLAQWQISLKRILFIYECLLELPVTIRRGEVVLVLEQFARAHGAKQVATMASPSPGFARICGEVVATGLEVKVYEVEPFVMLPEDSDLKRFSRYWKVAQKQLQREG